MTCSLIHIDDFHMRRKQRARATDGDESSGKGALVADGSYRKGFVWIIDVGSSSDTSCCGDAEIPDDIAAGRRRDER